MPILRCVLFTGFIAALSMPVTDLFAADQPDEVLGSLRLRGGIDLNPLLLPGGNRSGVAGVEAALAVGRQTGDLKIAASGEAERTEFSARGVAPLERTGLRLEAEHGGLPDWSLRSSTRLQSTAGPTVRAVNAAQRFRAQWTGGPIRPFLATEVRYASLNESNIILGDFLPEPQRSGTVIATPGFTVAFGKAQAGASVALSASRFAEPVDLFGYRRDNERIQPSVFYRYDSDGLDVIAAVSHLRGRFRDPDFTRVNEWLYDAALTRKVDRWTLELAVSRGVEETAFPVSPLALVTSASARLGFSPNDAWTVAAVARSLQVTYLDSPFSTRTFGYGLAASYAVTPDLSLGAEILRIEARTLTGDVVEGGAASLSLTQKLASAVPAKSGWAGEPPIRRSGPGFGSGGVTRPLRLPYQPP